MMLTESTVRIYEELADWHERQREARQRDLFLILAAHAAMGLGQRDLAERLRHRLLLLNPHHLLKPFASLAEALQSPDIKLFVEDLRRQFPPELAEKLLEATQRSQGVLDVAAEPVPTGLGPEVEPDLKVYPLQESTPKVIVSRVATVVSEPMVPQRGRAAESPYAVGLTDGHRPRRPAEEDETAGAWVAVALFILVLLGSAALTGYVFVVPFLDL